MNKPAPKTDGSRAQRERCFRQAGRAWARALVWIVQCEAGRRALARVLALRCDEAPEAGVWFHADTPVLEKAGSLLDDTLGRSLRTDRRYTGQLRITCDGIAAVQARLDEPVAEALMRRINEELARGHAWLHRIVIENQNLISYWMHGYARTPDQNRDDIAQAARLGLVRASQRFDVERGVQFSTCANQWFRSCVGNQRDSMRNQVSASRADLRNLRRLHAVLEAHGLTEPALHQAPWLADELGMTETEVVQLFALDHCGWSLNADPGDWAPTLRSKDDVEDGAIALEHTQMCENVMATLDARTQKVLRMRFGLGCRRPYEVNEIARQLDVSVERVRQLYKAALSALRHNQLVQQMVLPEAAEA